MRYFLKPGQIQEPLIIDVPKDFNVMANGVCFLENKISKIIAYKYDQYNFFLDMYCDTDKYASIACNKPYEVVLDSEINGVFIRENDEV